MLSSTSLKHPAVARAVAKPTSVAAVVTAVALMVSGCTIGDVSEQSADSQPAESSASDDAKPQPTRGPQGSANDPASGQGSGTSSGPLNAKALEEMLLPGTAIGIAGIGEAGDITIPAWSTIKVPIAIAAERAGTAQPQWVSAAISASDNAAAEQLWNSLGTPEQAAAATEAVLAEGDSPIAVSRVASRPGFSPYGQSQWTFQEQADLASNLRCLKGRENVLAAMEKIEPGQAYGLGKIPGAIFKGGWGPDESGSYDVRQFGLVPTGGGKYAAVAIGAKSTDGSYESAQSQLNSLSAALQTRLADLPPAKC